jgi:hypothetical protein
VATENDLLFDGRKLSKREKGFSARVLQFFLIIKNLLILKALHATCIQVRFTKNFFHQLSSKIFSKKVGFFLVKIECKYLSTD